MGWLETFQLFPYLESERLILRQLEAGDADSMFDYFSREKVAEYYDVERFTSRDEAVEMIEGLLYRYEARRQIRWGIVLKGEDKIIGTCGFHALEKLHLKAEVGYELHPDYWGKGIMTEAIKKIVAFGFAEMEFNRIEAFYNPVNFPSQKVLEKCGFSFEGILRKRFLMKGKYEDVALSAILKEDHNRCEGSLD